MLKKISMVGLRSDSKIPWFSLNVSSAYEGPHAQTWHEQISQFQGFSVGEINGSSKGFKAGPCTCSRFCCKSPQMAFNRKIRPTEGQNSLSKLPFVPDSIFHELESLFPTKPIGSQLQFETYKKVHGNLLSHLKRESFSPFVREEILRYVRRLDLRIKAYGLNT